jgi:hypothetical protein
MNNITLGESETIYKLFLWLMTNSIDSLILLVCNIKNYLKIMTNNINFNNNKDI